MPGIWRRVVNWGIALVQFPTLMVTGAWLYSLGYDLWSLVAIGTLLLVVWLVIGAVIYLALLKYSRWWRSIVLD